MESHGIPSRIQVTESTYQRLRGSFEFERRGEIEVRGKGMMTTYLLVGRRGVGAALDEVGSARSAG